MWYCLKKKKTVKLLKKSVFQRHLNLYISYDLEIALLAVDDLTSCSNMFSPSIEEMNQTAISAELPHY